MRGFSMLLVAVLASIGIGVGVEAANVASGPLPTFRTAVHSLGASPYLESTFTIDANGLPPTIERVVPKSERVTVEVASVDGRTALDALPSGGPVDLQFSVADLSGTLADIRLVFDGTRQQIFARVFPTRFAMLPSIAPRIRSLLERVGALIDGQWFSAPPMALSSPSVQHRRSQAQSAAAGATFERDLLATTHLSSRPVAAGTETEGTIGIESLVSIVDRDLFPLFARAVGPRFPLGRLGVAAQSAAGRATVAVVTDGDGTMTAGSIAVVERGRTVDALMKIRHDAIAIGVPRDVRPLPRSLLGGIARWVRFVPTGGLEAARAVQVG